MMLLLGGYDSPEAILFGSTVMFACATASAAQMRPPFAQGANFDRHRAQRRLAKFARWLAIWSALVALIEFALFWRYQLDPEYQPSNFSFDVRSQVERVIQVAVLVGLPTLAMTALLPLARLVVALRTHGDDPRSG